VSYWDTADPGRTPPTTSGPPPTRNVSSEKSTLRAPAGAAAPAPAQQLRHGASAPALVPSPATTAAPAGGEASPETTSGERGAAAAAAPAPPPPYTPPSPLALYPDAWSPRLLYHLPLRRVAFTSASTWRACGERGPPNEAAISGFGHDMPSEPVCMRVRVCAAVWCCFGMLQAVALWGAFVHSI
jgi:hypothetical protein